MSTEENPLLWTPSQLVVWLATFESGRFAILASQLKSFSGRQVIELSHEQWARVEPAQLASSLRFTLLGMAHLANNSQIQSATATTTHANYTAMNEQNKVKGHKNKRKATKFPPMIEKPTWTLIIFIVLITAVLVLFVTIGKDFLNSRGYSTTKFLEIAAIPIISVAFTYVHIWLALYMTFYPLEYIGILQFPGTNTGVCGWQGIVPFKAEKMARMSVNIMTTQLMDVKEIFSRIDPKQVSKELEPILFHTIQDIIESMALKYNPALWKALPQAVKDEIIEKVKEEAPQHIASMMLEIRSNIEDVFDIEDMVVSHMVNDKQLLVNMFVTCGYQELAFIRNSGAWMGGIFGLIQMGVYFTHLNDLIVFPVFGFVVGTLTNWLALKMIFEPVNPRKVCCLTLHGLFLRRQQEVAAVYGRLVAAEILNSANIIEAILKGPASDKLFELVYVNVQHAVQESASVADKIVSIGIGKETYGSIKDDITDHIVQKFPDSLRHIEGYTTRALDMETTLKQKMGELSFEAFERLLHPVFEEDEWKLILMGGVLGLVIGFVQVYGIGI